MASVLAVRALHTSGILEKLAAKGAPHNVVELLYHEFVAVLLNNVIFALSNSALTIKADVERSPIFGLFDYG